MNHPFDKLAASLLFLIVGLILGGLFLAPAALRLAGQDSQAIEDISELLIFLLPPLLLLPAVFAVYQRQRAEAPGLAAVALVAGLAAGGGMLLWLLLLATRLQPFQVARMVGFYGLTIAGGAWVLLASLGLAGQPCAAGGWATAVQGAVLLLGPICGVAMILYGASLLLNGGLAVTNVAITLWLLTYPLWLLALGGWLWGAGQERSWLAGA